jgi:hypothetical protein
MADVRGLESSGDIAASGGKSHEASESIENHRDSFLPDRRPASGYFPSKPNAVTLFDVPTYTLPFTIMGVPK